MTDRKQTSLGKKHGKLFLQILREDRMIPEFYAVLNEKMESMDNSVRDIIKYVENASKHDSKHDSSAMKKLALIPEITRRIHVNAFLIDMLTNSVSKGITKLCRIYDFTDQDIRHMIPDHFAKYDSILVIGCSESSDIDVCCYVREQDCYMGKTKELPDEEIESIREQLRSLGYDVDRRDLDLNVIYVDPIQQMITASSKGGTETQNIINATYMLHRQIMCPGSDLPLAMHLHPVKNIEFTREEIFEKLRAFAKYVLDYAEDVSRDYLAFRPIKSDLYTQGGDEMMRFMKGILKYIVYDPVDVKRFDLDPIKYHDRFKSMTMKLLQILMHNRCNATAYVKADLAKSVHRIFADEGHELLSRYEAGAAWYLFRGNRGTFCPELFPMLLEQYDLIVDEFLSSIDIEPIVFDEDKISTVQREHKVVEALNDRMMSLFLKSPDIFTEEFETLWTGVHGSSLAVNSQFRIQSSDEKTFYESYKDLEPDVLSIFKQCFIFVDQRSPEWLSMLSQRFVCGNNNGTIDNSTFQGRYNLIRGATIELLAMHLFDPVLHAGLKGFKKWSLGFIVERNAVGSKGFAPDMVLISEPYTGSVPEFILVEIKGLKHSRKTGDYYRGLHLATKQIGSGRHILSQFVSQEKLKIRRGLIILCCVEDQQFKMEVHHIDL